MGIKPESIEEKLTTGGDSTLNERQFSTHPKEGTLVKYSFQMCGWEQRVVKIPRLATEDSHYHIKQRGQRRKQNTEPSE